MSRSREPKTSPRRLKAAKRHAEALKLRIMGHDFRTIARKLNYAGPSSAYKAVTSALRKSVVEPSDELRKLELERLDKLSIAIWPKALSGELGAVDRLLKIMERRAKMTGIDARTEYTIDDIRSIAGTVVNVINAEIQDKSVRNRIFAALGFTGIQ